MMSTAPLSVREVANETEMMAFLSLPWTVYKDDPCWVAPLWADHVAFFDPAKSPELRHIDLAYFVAWRGDQPVGTIIAHENHAYNEFQGVKIGWFGQFEVLEDAEAAAALLEKAESWVRARGLPTIRGPATFSTNSEIGLLIDGFDIPPKILMRHDRPYYRRFIEDAGYVKAMDLWAYHFDGENWGGRAADKLPPKLARVVEHIRRRRNFTLRNVNMRDFDTEVERVKAIYNSAWERNWGFVPLSEAEIDKMAEDLKSIVDPDIVFFIEVNGQPVAFGLPIPNLYEPLRKVRCRPGEPHWWQLLRLVWHWKVRGHLSSVRVWALGVLEEYRGTGIDALLYYEMVKAGLSKGYMDIEMSWILEDNDMMNRSIKVLGGEVYKTYRVYEKAL
jgi:GNAT superfamily N-acetyltransferase